jgi:hypothetical protein
MPMVESKVLPNLASASVSAASRAAALLRDTRPGWDFHSAWVAQQPRQGHRVRQPVQQLGGSQQCSPQNQNVT